MNTEELKSRMEWERKGYEGSVGPLTQTERTAYAMGFLRGAAIVLADYNERLKGLLHETTTSK